MSETPPPTQTLIGPKTDAELAAELAQSQVSNAEREQQLAKAIETKDATVMSELTGKDIDFDVNVFIKAGAIRKENLKVYDGFFIDMQTITQREKITAEHLVKARYGNLAVTDNVYANALETAVLAVAITRINNREYPIPTTSTRGGASIDPTQLEVRTRGKLDLYDTLLDANEKLINTLSMIYNRLEYADVLKEQEGIDIAKKSEEPSLQKSSGSSAGN